MTSPILYFTEGYRMIKNRLTRKGFKRYEGSAEEICRQIIEDCWNGTYFQTSTTNFAQFWTRDFGMCIESLIRLGHKERVIKTLKYALAKFAGHGKVTTTITPKGKPYDFPRIAADSLPWLIYSCTFVPEVIKGYEGFIEKEAEKYAKVFIDKDGLIKKKHFSSIKDFAIRKSSCYDNVMAIVLSRSLEKLGFNNNNNNIIKTFWNGRYFYDDLSKKEYIAGDANLFPFYFGLADKKMLKSAIEHIKANKLDEPLPLKYTTKDAPVKFIWQEKLMKGYELDACWLHMGPLYVKVAEEADKAYASRLKEKYNKAITQFGTYPEVLDSNGKPFKALFYHCDEGMLWAANLL